VLEQNLSLISLLHYWSTLEGKKDQKSNRKTCQTVTANKSGCWVVPELGKRSILALVWHVLLIWWLIGLSRTYGEQTEACSDRLCTETVARGDEPSHIGCSGGESMAATCPLDPKNLQSNTATAAAKDRFVKSPPKSRKWTTTIACYSSEPCSFVPTYFLCFFIVIIKFLY